ncbi:MAG: DinB family protein [Rhodothermaceae bacterium]
MELKQKWFDRKFSFDIEVKTFPLIVERLRGTPARIDDRLRRLNPEFLTKRISDEWTIQENIGHLFDVENIWKVRLEDILEGKEFLTEVDLTNKITDDADHNEKDVSELLIPFQIRRNRLVEKLELVSDGQIEMSALHPRLKTPIRIIDLAFFVAEHDDHHLALVTRLLKRFK